MLLGPRAQSARVCWSRAGLLASAVSEAGRLHLTTGQSFLAAVAVGREFAELELHTRRTSALGSQSARVCWSQRSWVTRARFARAKSECIHVDAYSLVWGPPGTLVAVALCEVYVCLCL